MVKSGLGQCDGLPLRELGRVRSLFEDTKNAMRKWCMIGDLVAAVEFTPELVYLYLARRGTGSRMVYTLLSVAISFVYLMAGYIIKRYEGVVGQVNGQSSSVDLDLFVLGPEVDLMKFWGLLWIPLAVVFALAILWASQKQRRAMQEAILEMVGR